MKLMIIDFIDFMEAGYLLRVGQACKAATTTTQL
jgi:hypothetical protein